MPRAPKFIATARIALLREFNIDPDCVPRDDGFSSEGILVRYGTGLAAGQNFIPWPDATWKQRAANAIDADLAEARAQETDIIATRDRSALEVAIGAVIWNASNHPNPTAVLGRDIGPLRTKLVDAVLAAGFTHTATAAQPQEVIEDARFDGTITRIPGRPDGFDLGIG